MAMSYRNDLTAVSTPSFALVPPGASLTPLIGSSSQGSLGMSLHEWICKRGGGMGDVAGGLFALCCSCVSAFCPCPHLLLIFWTLTFSPMSLSSACALPPRTLTTHTLIRHYFHTSHTCAVSRMEGFEPEATFDVRTYKTMPCMKQKARAKRMRKNPSSLSPLHVAPAHLLLTCPICLIGWPHQHLCQLQSRSPIPNKSRNASHLQRMLERIPVPTGQSAYAQSPVL